MIDISYKHGVSSYPNAAVWDYLKLLVGAADLEVCACSVDAEPIETFADVVGKSKGVGDDVISDDVDVKIRDRDIVDVDYKSGLVKPNNYCMLKSDKEV